MYDDITAVPGIKVGHATDPVALTGCTVILCEAGAVVSADVRGGGPATRETDLCLPGRHVQKAQAILLSGGSAFGLEAAGGVMRWLEERGLGQPALQFRVPIVPAACIFDLALGNGKVRPDAAMGYAACAAAAAAGPLEQGCVGAGTGATVGKLGGPEHATKSGLGSAAVYLPGGLIVGALAVCNALGDVVDAATGQLLAGVRNPAGGWRRGRDILLGAAPSGAVAGTNTSIGCIATNAVLSKEQVHKLAQVGHDGLARAVDPVHLPMDGDALFALATGAVEPLPEFGIVMLCNAAAVAVERAIHSAVRHATAAGGLPAARDWR